MFGPAMLRDEQIAPLAEGVCGVLEEVGILCQNDDLLRGLADFGAHVDAPAQRVKFPRELTARFVAGVRDSSTGRSGWPAQASAPGLATVSTHVAQFFFDHETGERRSSNREDFITCTKFGSVLAPEGASGHALSMTDVPPILEPLHAALLLAEWAYDPGPPFAWNVRQVEYLVEMGEILGKRNWFSLGAMCFAHPLRLDRDVADRFVRQVRSGGTAGITAMPVAGITTPITLEGFVVVAAAEVIATWMAGRGLNPNAPLGGSMWSGTMDMRTGSTSYSAFDALLYGCVCVEFIRRWTGVCIPVGSGDYCDAKVPGLYTALEKAYKAMVISAFTGQPLSAGTGLIDDGKTLSLVQLLLDRDYAAGAGHLARELDPSPENIALPTIAEVDIGLGRNYFETEHTLRHFRDSAWLPQLIDRSGWNGFAAEAVVLDKARQQVRETIAQYRKPEGREDQLEAMRRVLQRAERELG